VRDMFELSARVQTYVDERVATGHEVGIQVAVLWRGELVVDVVAGRADLATARPVDPETLFFAASTAKGVASTVAHVLVERGELADDLPLVDVWPEFGAHGKHAVTVRHVLQHTAGVTAVPYDTTIADLCDWDHMCAVLAAAEPWWPPGSRFGYHAQTFGFLLGEVVRRATRRSLTTCLRELVTGPLGVVDDVHFGVPPALLPRVAIAVPPRSPAGPPPERGSPADLAVPPGVRADADYANRADVLTADIPSGGTMTARGVATIYSALLGYHEGVRLVAPERLSAIATPGPHAYDHVMGMPSAWAFGYSPHRPGATPTRPGSTFGMAGANGSAAYADIDSGVAVAVMRNRFDADFTTAAGVDQIVAEAIGLAAPEDEHQRTTPRRSR
jgi:CubicO group peptidase (beta-lactamase class C family)